MLFAVGDRMLLSTEHLKMLGSEKRIQAHVQVSGSFQDRAVIRNNEYEFDLPERLHLHIHPVLNIDRMKAYEDRVLGLSGQKERSSGKPALAIVTTGRTVRRGMKWEVNKRKGGRGENQSQECKIAQRKPKSSKKKPVSRIRGSNPWLAP